MVQYYCYHLKFRTHQLICILELIIWYLSFPELVLSHEVLFGTKALTELLMRLVQLI